MQFNELPHYEHCVITNLSQEVDHSESSRSTTTSLSIPNHSFASSLPLSVVLSSYYVMGTIMSLPPCSFYSFTTSVDIRVLFNLFSNFIKME